LNVCTKNTKNWKRRLEKFSPKTEKKLIVAKKHQITTLEIITERDKEEEEDKELRSNSGVPRRVLYFPSCV
jgi:hypothetical protein